MWKVNCRIVFLSLVALASLLLASGHVYAKEPLALDKAEALGLIAHTPNLFIMDVRNPDEYAAGHIDGAVNIPRPELEQHLSELPTDRPILIYCASGKRAGEAYAIVHKERPDLLLLFVATEGLL